MKTGTQQRRVGARGTIPSASEAADAGIRTVSIIGAGVMGRGIAAANVRAGIRVRIRDVNDAAAAAAVDEIRGARRATSVAAPHFAQAPAAPLISVATTDAEIGDADLIIEAVAEDVTTKADVLSRIQPCLGEQTIVASNSSGIPIGQLGSSCRDPSRFCGLHFCHPVSDRPLVEVVGSDATSVGTIDRAFRYAKSIGMAPIVVRDSPGFLLNRLLVPYFNEALELLLDGTTIQTLDQAALEFGMPLGPLAHLDEFGIDVALAVGRTLFWTYPDRIVPSELLIAMYKSGRLGRKSGGGFYAAPRDAAGRQLAPPVAEMIRERQRAAEPGSVEHVARRLRLPMLLEATRTLEEALVDSPAVIDTALRDGLGMTSSWRGLLAWADTIGAATILEWLRPLEELGNRFLPTRRLLDIAATRQRFLM